MKLEAPLGPERKKESLLMILKIYLLLINQLTGVRGPKGLKNGSHWISRTGVSMDNVGEELRISMG